MNRNFLLAALTLTTVAGLWITTRDTAAQVATPAAQATAAGKSSGPDWAMWAGTPGRNMVSAEKNPPIEFDPGKKLKGKDEVDLATTKGLKWATRLGSQAYGTVIVSDGKVLLGTNNENPFDSKYQIKNKDTGKVVAEDRSVVLCLDEKTGQMIWQFASPKLGTGKVSDWEYLGICATATAEGKYVYIPTNRCEVVCLDIAGLKDGNQGMQDEAKYLSSPDNKIQATGDTDADIIWTFDMREECGVFPHNTTSSNILIVGEKLYVTTSNGVDWTHTNIPAPEAPSLICLDKKTGKLLGEDGSGISQKDRMLHCSWSSPALAKKDGKEQIIFAAGDGLVYGYDLTFKKDGEFDIINEIWRVDANPKEYRVDDTGKKRAYNTYEGPSEIIATPVIYKDRVYVPVGQDPEHGEGKGCMNCIDLAGKIVWTFKEINRSISTPAIVDDIVYVADYSGLIYALDASTGVLLSKYDTKGHIWGSTLYVDGKIYIGNEEGELHILKAAKQLEKVAVIDFPGSLFATPVYANGTLYIQTMSQLYAFGVK